MKVCVVGSGGREHALAQVLARTAEVVVAPGNPGIPGSVGLDGPPPEEISADLYVIGPEVPLVEGLADRMRAQGRLVLGPGADGARLEGSKAWMKALLVEAGVPTAAHASFREVEPALAYLRDMPGDLFVVKTDGLAGGKGVFVTAERAEAAEDIRAKLAGESFGSAGHRVVLEEGLVGQEVSLLAVTDGRDLSVLPLSQDHKRVGDGDTGLNTGGMGAYCPLPQFGPADLAGAVKTCVEPTLAALAARGIDYRGVLYAGLMMTATGPRVIEYNVRFGDPEAEAVLPLLDGDVATWLASAAAGRLEGDPGVSSDACLTVILCAPGYGRPEGPRLGDRIEGLEAATEVEGVTVFHAGTARGPDGGLYTAGGRVLAVTARRPDLTQAREAAYAAAGRIHWDGIHYRRDIGSRGLAASAAEGSRHDNRRTDNRSPTPEGADR